MKDKNIWEIAEEIFADVPDKEWEKLPTDLSKNYKHYLYGTPKIEENDELEEDNGIYIDSNQNKNPIHSYKCVEVKNFDKIKELIMLSLNEFGRIDRMGNIKGVQYLKEAYDLLAGVKIDKDK